MTKSFKSYNSFRSFAYAVKTKARYLFDPENSDFLEAVASTSRSRVTTVERGEILYRAQLGHAVDSQFGFDEESQQEYHEIDWYIPFAESRLRPEYGRANEGRANPKGVPVFYSATDKSTAIAEVRPWIGSYVSYGRFRVNRALRMVNCSVNYKGPRKLSTTISYS